MDSTEGEQGLLNLCFKLGSSARLQCKVLENARAEQSHLGHNYTAICPTVSAAIASANFNVSATRGTTNRNEAWRF